MPSWIRGDPSVEAESRMTAFLVGFLLVVGTISQVIRGVVIVARITIVVVLGST